MVYIAKNKHLRKSINLPVTNYKLIFITLTLSATQIHSDAIIKKQLLQPFIRLLRNKWNIQNYLWKAEAQDNGNIHFHITTDRFIHWEEIRNTWNTIQETLTDKEGKGYISRSKSTNPNSTDVHAVYKVKNLASYLCKYISKKDIVKSKKNVVTDPEHYYKIFNQITACDLNTREEIELKRGIEGKLYDCNRELKNIKAVHDMQYALSDDLESKFCKKIDNRFFTLHFHDHPTNNLPALKMVLDHHIRLSFHSKTKTQ